ncbi:hypothetical protein HHSLTHF2_06720 [Vreelandella venusta]|uniref:Holin of 3TMs, for gene-transfer release n=1 Tax=Halomonas hydrothermalis TaxID=115561 RepID=A0A6F8U010_9GAMM|nr:3TM-type holin [Halomonas hydrothermalis]BCB06782.1 hypothetical protein HHSLTHF2_06720 [Halomonas hydrothermalis]
MNWRDAIEEVAKYAPAVATALGGPAVGGITSGVATMVTSALGVRNSPAALVSALEDPVKRETLVRLNNEHERELISIRLQAETAQAQEETKRLSEVNQTIRAELATEGWWRSGWRPFNGWMLSASLAAVNFGLVAVVIRDPTQLQVVVEVLIWSVVAQGAVQGVNIKKRSDDKQVMMGRAPTSFMDAIRKGKG